MSLFVDFETQSACDLKAYGPRAYALHPTTRILCVSVAVDDGPVKVFSPETFLKFLQAIKFNEKIEVIAHNVNFELELWNQCGVRLYGWPTLSPGQVDCTMVRAYAMGLPGSLENASAAVGIEEGKDQAGHRVMLKLAKPKKDGSFWTPEEVPEDFKTLYKYCAQDAVVERDLHSKIRRLIPSEKKIWELDYKINDRGIGVDVKSAKKASQLVESELMRLDHLIHQLTDGFVGQCSQAGRITQYFQSKGLKVESVKAETIQRIIDKKELPIEIRRVALIRQLAAKTSTAKLDAIIRAENTGGRLHHCFQYHVAGTGRWGGRRLQPQNLPRGTMKPEEVEKVFEVLNTKDLVTARDEIAKMQGSVLATLSSCIRGMIVPAPGNDFIGADFSSIEARITAWLAGQEERLDEFRKKIDPYLAAASGTFNVPITEVNKTQRQVGKAQVLAFGFGGGAGAYLRFVPKELGHTEKEGEQFKDVWRANNPKIVKMWYQLERAALAAMNDPGKWFATNKVKYCKSGSFLLCRLPSGRDIVYPYPKVEMVETPWGEKRACITAMWVDSKTNQWTRRKCWYGILVENCVQAVASDLLRAALVDLDACNYDIVGHFHDEVLLEVPLKWSSVETIEQIIKDSTPSWCADLPVGVEGWRGSRYQK